ncbi:hypothetical protein AAVH_03273 [Aphelenchoides avenae]|nr:hypothetical protein AAVH_03273 [Aphelenchus avenae]
MRPSERLLILSAVASVFTAAVLSQSLPVPLPSGVSVTINVQLNSSTVVPFTGRMPFTFALHIDCYKDARFELSSGLCTLSTEFTANVRVLRLTMPQNGREEQSSVAYCSNVKDCVVKFWISQENVTYEVPNGPPGGLFVPCEWKSDNKPLRLNIMSSAEMKSCKKAFLEVDASVWQLYEQLPSPTLTTANTSAQGNTSITSLPSMNASTHCPVHISSKLVDFAGIAWWGWLAIGAGGTLAIVLLVVIVAAVCCSRRSKKASTRKPVESEDDTKSSVTVVPPKPNPPIEAKVTASVDISKSKRPDPVQPKLESKEPSAPPPHPAMQSNDQYIKSIQSMPPAAAVEQGSKKDSEKAANAPPMPRKILMTMEKPKKGDEKQGEIDTLDDPVLDQHGWNSAEESATQKKISKRSREDPNPAKDKGSQLRSQDEVRTRDTQISSAHKPLTHDKTPSDIKNW